MPGYTYAAPEAHILMAATPPRRSLTGLSPAERAQLHHQHRLRWLQLRTEGIGAADASTILGVNPHSSLTQLYAAKTVGHVVGDNDQMRVGREMEATVRARFVEATGLPTRRVGLLAHNEQPWMRCTPDYLVGDGSGLECKTTTERQAEQWDEAPSDHALAQAQWCMAVTGLYRWHVAVLFRDSGRFEHYEVERDEGLIEILVERAAAFWFGNVMQLTAPPLDGTEATHEAVRALHPHTVPDKVVDGGERAAMVRRRLARIQEEKRRLEAEENEARAELVAMAGDAHTLTGDATRTELDEHGARVVIEAQGVRVATLARNGTFAKARYARDFPEHAARYTRTVDELDVGRALAEDPEAANYVPRVLRLSSRDWRPWSQAA